ncbi:unnamed protein product [Pleuronectes platessa]|uniref:Uncharacterized protein n=1 Tax=Pleuronectes platessa TaxID=8262 RepID=A0A9N7U4T0_PLEPL|nr:unnamed protein product [Pleuronectes platessa]
MNGAVWSTWRHCMPVAMPSLPGNKGGKGLCVTAAERAPRCQRGDGEKRLQTDSDLSEQRSSLRFRNSSLCYPVTLKRSEQLSRFDTPQCCVSSLVVVALQQFVWRRIQR